MSVTFPKQFYDSKSLDKFQDLLVIVDTEKQEGFFNLAWKKLLGYDPKSLTLSGLYKHIHPEDRERTLEFSNKVSSQRITADIDNRYITADGEYKWISWHVFSDDKYLWCLGKDITLLKEQEELIRETQKDAKIGSWRIDLVGGPPRLTWTEEVFKIYGVDVGVAMDVESAISYFAPEDRPRISKYVQEAMELGKSYDDEFEFRRKAGETIWVRAIGAPVYLGEKIVAVRGTFQDITVRKRAEIEREEKSRRLRRIIENVPGMVYRYKQDIDGQHYFTFINDVGFGIYEIDRETEKQDPSFLVNMVHPDDSKELWAKIKESAENLSDFYFRGRIVTGKKRVKWIEARSIPERQPNGATIWDGILLDVTPQVEASRALEEARFENAHAAKLASLGEMAASIGHEINNPLAIIHGYAEKAMKILDSGNVDISALKPLIEKIMKSEERINVIVRSMRKLSGRDEAKTFKPIPFFEIINDCIDLCAEKFKLAEIDLQVQEIDPKVEIECMPSQISQVILNLLNNAYDAVVSLPKKWVKIDYEVRERHLLIFVTDSGSGIPKKYHEKLWTPFFTSKEVGKGTGLGLSISKRIIESHKGKISFDPNATSTRFVIDLPMNQSSL